MRRQKENPQSENEDLVPQAHMFTLRIWVTNQKDTDIEWRGRIQHVQSGEVKYCQTWGAFTAYVEEILSNPSDI
jgi:hypothetical protein